MNKLHLRRYPPVFFILIFFVSLSSQAGTALWIAESEGALKITGETGEIVFEIPGAGGVDRIAVDNDNGRVWTYGGHKHQRRLKAYDGDGHLQVDVSTPQIHKQTRLGDMLADADGVWFAAGRDLYRYDMQGQLQKHIRFRRDVTAMTLDSERAHLWVAVADHVFIVDRNGEDVDRFWTLLPLITRLDYDQHQDGVWLVVGPYLLRLNAHDRELEFVSRFGVGFKLWRHLSTDGQGGVWGADPLTLSHVNAAGEVEFSFKAFNDYHGQKTLQDLAADPEDGAVWLANKTTLKKYSVVGALQRELTPDLGDGVIRSINRMALTAQSRPPELQIVFPEANGFINTNTPTLELHYSSEGVIDTDSIEITHDDSALSANCGATQTEASCALNAPLPEGEVTLEATVADTDGNLSEPARVTFTVDTVAPLVTVTHPADGLITNSVQLAVSGNLSEAVESLTLIHNAGSIGLQADDNNAFSHNVTLSEGGNTIAVSAVDFAGNAGEIAVNVTLDTIVPAVPDLGLIEIVRPDDEGNVMIVGRAGSVEPNSRIAITNTRTGESIIVTADADGAFTAHIAGAVGDDIQMTAADAAGNASEPARAPVTHLPPDPAVIAPPLNPTQITPLSEATAFLYTGNNPIQTGVPSGTIEAGRVAVIRGRVLDKQNHPLPGVTVSIKDHPEFGQTISRADGGFDLAVNGGGILTLNYQKANYLPVQRKVNAPWRDYVFADDVVMIQLDPQVTTIDLTSTEIQVARGTPQTDEDGTRQATLLFPTGTTASMTLPDGSVQSLTTLSVRATEYTVGDNGFEAMPGELPPASGYTYAVELSVDEALAVNAKRVNFNQPVPFYVDNFLDFPTGEAVPVGYYDTDKAAWIPYDDGRIVEILAIDNDVAMLDVNGNGAPATPAQLDALGIADAELRQLAALYEPGKSLWRVSLNHFSAWDCNWPYGPPNDATPPPAQEPEDGKGDEPNDSDDENECEGCVISPQAQTVGEEISVTGTPFSLHYRSDRAAGGRANRVTIPVSGDTLPNSLRLMRVTVAVAGRYIDRTFDPRQTNLNYTFEWDGLDGFGREVYGSVKANIAVTYHYQCIYLRASGGGVGRRSFGRASIDIEAIGTRRNCESIVLPRRSQVTLESPLTPPVVVAGDWSLDVQHAWDSRGLRLLQGDGGHRIFKHGIISTVAGSGGTVGGFEGDGGPATEARFDEPGGVAVDAAGNLYIADTSNNRIRRVSRDGIVITVAGSGRTDLGGYGGDGGPAVNARLNHPQAVAVDSAGNLYIADTGNKRIRRVDSNGIIATVAGNGIDGFSGDGGPATEATLSLVYGLTVDAAGNLYLADLLNHRVRQVSPDGFITTVAGTGVRGSGGDGGPATQATLFEPVAVTVDPAGNLYIAENRGNKVRRVSPDGIITTVAGRDEFGPVNDGGPATEATLRAPYGLAVDAVGNLYIVDRNQARIRRVDANGIITTVAGSGVSGFAGDDGLGAQASFRSMRHLAIDAAGNLYIADTGNHRIRRLATQGIFSRQPMVVSKDGVRQFVFDEGGRHLRTINALTGATEYEFGRDNEGRLTSITDIDGDVTTIERDAQGKALAIISPDGQRTGLTIDGNGHLGAVVNPAGETWRMKYTPDGLMTEFRDRKDQPDTFDYDDEGNLILNINAGLGGWTLDRTGLDDGYRVTMTTAENRQLDFTVEPQANGDRKQVNTHADGGVQTRLFETRGREITTQPDGTVTTVQEGPDPRFGMQSPLPQSLTVRTPSGLTSTTTTTRTTVLSNPADVLSLQSLTEVTTINGKAYRSEYDAATKTFAYTSPEGRTGVQTINDQARPVRTAITGLAPVDFGYDARGRLERIFTDDGVEQRLTVLDYYDSGPRQGFLESITDAANRTVRFEYDPVGRVTKQILPDSREINYGYDANGNVTSIQPPGRPAHIFNYNAFNLEDEYTPPDVEGIANPATVYDYNLDKELTRITRPDGQEVNFAYNNKAQLESMTIPRGTYRYGYHPTTGQLESIAAPDGGTLAYGYDGFLLKGQTWGGEISGGVTQSYNNNFLISQRCVNASDCISFGYDNDSLLTSAGSLSIIRDPQRTGLITDTALSNVVTNNGYNLFGELESFEAKYSNTQYFNTVFIRDSLGRIKQKTETVQGETVTEIYGYDLTGRLETVTRGSDVITYQYDDNGNRESKLVNGVAVEAGVYDDQDRLTSYNGCRYQYTDNGELQTKTCGSEVTTYGYDVLGNLLGVTLPDGTETEYVIDGQNRRIGKKIDGALVQGFLYADQLNPIAELDADGSIRSRFVYSTKINVPDYMVRDDVTYRIISDHLGSPRLVINVADGSVVQRMDYDEFGNVALDTNPGFQPFGFAGGVYDRQTGLVRFGVRDYSAETGRWTTKDPIEFGGLDTNLYGYSFKDPINFIDPTGQFGIAGAVIGGIIGGVIGGINAGLSGGNVAAGFFTGAAAGAITGMFPIGLVGSLAIGNWAAVGIMAGGAAIGAVVGAAGEIANQRINGKCFDAFGVGMAAIGGAIGGVAGGFGAAAGAGKIATAVISSGFGSSVPFGATVGFGMATGQL